MKALSILFLIVACIISADAKPHKNTRKDHRNMALTKDLAAMWNMEQNPILFPVHDQSGNGNHLTGSAGAVLVEGKINEGIELTGTSTLNLASNAGISHQGEAFTVGFWFKPLVLDSALAILGHPDGEWLVQMELSGSDFYLRVRIAPDGADTIMNVTDVPMVIGEWYWVAFGWYDDNGSYAWATVNLSERVRAALAGPLPAPLVTPPIFWNPHVFDDTAIWRRNVSANELREIYNGGKGLSFEEWDAPDVCDAITCCD